MKTLIAIVSSIYNYVSQSSKRASKLKDLNEILEEKKNIKLKKIFEIRWLSMGDTVLAIIRNYEALLILTSEEATLGDPIAIGLHHQLSYVYLVLKHLTSDIFAETNHLSKIFQFGDVCFGSLQQSPFETISSLQDMRKMAH